MRSLLLVLLVGCGGPSDGPVEPLRRPSGVLQAPEDGSGVQVSSETGAEMDVRIDIPLPRTAAKGTIAFIGVDSSKRTEDWMAGGDKPAFYWISPVVEYADSFSLKAPLPGGLHFMAVVNQGDGDDLPGPGDLHSDPTPWDGTSPLVLTVDRRYGEAAPRSSGAGAVEASPEVDVEGPRFPVTVRVADGLPRPRGKTRLIVLGRDPALGGAGGPPAFFWRSPQTRVSWPWTVDIPLPDALEFELVLDSDGDGMPSPGDLLSALQAEIRSAEGEPVEVLLDRRFAMPGGSTPQ